MSRTPIFTVLQEEGGFLYVAVQKDIGNHEMVRIMLQLIDALTDGELLVFAEDDRYVFSTQNE